MLDFLSECGFSNDTIREIEKNSSNDLIYDLSLNKENCIKIINFMKENNITCIDKLLINEPYIFLGNFDKFYKKFSNFDLGLLSEALNIDYELVEKII